MSTQLTVNKSFLPAPTNFDEAWRMAQVLADSDMVPKDFKGKPGNCLIAMQWGSDLGIPGIQALQNIAVINNRPSIWGDAAKALVIGRPDCDDINEYFEGEGDHLTALCVVSRKGKSPVTGRFSIADAKAAGLLGKAGPWTQYRNRMLQMRARGFALRDAFPDALRGLSIAEESQDLPVEKIINPATSSKSVNQSQSQEPLTVEQLLLKIKTMCVSDFKSVDPEPYSKADRLILRAAMNARRDEIKAEQQERIVADITAEVMTNENDAPTATKRDLPGLINACSTKPELERLMSTITEAEMARYSEFIEMQLDLFR